MFYVQVVDLLILKVHLVTSPLSLLQWEQVNHIV